MFAAGVPVSIAAYAAHGMSGVVASIAAAGCCLAGAIPPLALARLLPGHTYALHHVGLGMLFRMGIPLGIGLSVHVQGLPLAKSGFLLALVVYFWVGLIFDTLSMLSSIHAPAQTTERLR
jgi:hypothetical protein